MELPPPGAARKGWCKLAWSPWVQKSLLVNKEAAATPPSPPGRTSPPVQAQRKEEAGGSGETMERAGRLTRSPPAPASGAPTYLAHFLRVWRDKSWPLWSSTTALTFWPQTTSGAPITATSAGKEGGEQACREKGRSSSFYKRSLTRKLQIIDFKLFI